MKELAPTAELPHVWAALMARRAFSDGTTA
jgi:hypothetical protein